MKADTERLIHLIEECGEVIQAASKVLRFGWNGRYDDGETNKDRLESEIGDLLGAIVILTDSNDVNERSITLQCEEKKKKFIKNSFHQK